MAKEIGYYIAQRTSRSKSRGGGGVMLPVATLSIALSIAVMIITLAVVLGFKNEVNSKLTSLSGQIVMSSVEGVNSASANAINLTPEAEAIATQAAKDHGTELHHISPVATCPAVVRNADFVEGALLKGVDESYDRSLFEEGLIEGEVVDFSSEKPSREAIISHNLATSAGLGLGDKLELLIMSDDGGMRRDLYKIGAIYSSGLGEAEKLLIFTDIRNVQRVNGWSEDQVTNYELWLSSPKRATEVAEQINRDIVFSDSKELESVVAYDLKRLYPSIFDWLAAHDINALVIIVIMMVVALFNITTAILILVLERTQLIGMLKVLGMADSEIRKIFLYRALGITARGLLYGNIAAIIFCLIQHYYKPIKLDDVGYILSAVPIDLSLWWLLLLNLGVVGVIFLLIVIPTKIVGRIEPSRAIKFQ